MFGKDNTENNGLKLTRNIDSQKSDEQIENMLKEVKITRTWRKIFFNNLDDAMGDVRNNAKRVYTGCLNDDGHGKQLTQDWRNKKP